MSGTKARVAAYAQALASARSLLASGSPDPERIGDLVWWSNTSDWNADANYAATVFAAHDIDPDATLPPAPDWLAAHGRAVLTAAAHAKGRGFTLLDAANGPSGERRTNIVRIARNGRVTTTDEGTVSTARDGASPPVIERADTSDAEEIASAFKAQIMACHDTYRADDVRIAIVTWLELHSALLVRPGLHWVPPAASPAIDLIDSAVTQLAWGTVEAYQGRRTEPRSLRAVRSVVVDGIAARVDALASAATELSTAKPGPRGTRASTIQAYVDEAKRTQADLATYTAVTHEPLPEVQRDIARSLETLLALAAARGDNARSQS